MGIPQGQTLRYPLAEILEASRLAIGVAAQPALIAYFPNTTRKASLCETPALVIRVAD